jgi:molybdenum cofactor cytidylyltransferase
VIIGILLAAGQARRFGSQKLLATLPNTAVSVVGRSAANLLAGVDGVIAVSAREERVMRALDAAGCEVVVNERAVDGMGTSIATGVRASKIAANDATRNEVTTNEVTSGWIIALGDMPYLDVKTIVQIKEALETGAEIVVPRVAGTRGHPVGFSATYRAALLALSGDRGAKSIIDANLARVSWLDIQDQGVLADIDIPADLR